MAKTHLKDAKRELMSGDVTEALINVDKAGDKLKDLSRMNGLQRDQKSAVTAAKTKTTLARKELEAVKSDPKGDHAAKATALVDQALERLQ